MDQEQQQQQVDRKSSQYQQRQSAQQKTSQRYSKQQDYHQDESSQQYIPPNQEQQSSQAQIKNQPEQQRRLRFQLPKPQKSILKWRKTKILFWEMIGTAILTYGIAASTEPIYQTVSLLAGLLIVQPFTGGHLNPAVSFAFVMKRYIGPFDFTFRAVGQVFGACIGAFFSFIVLNRANGPTIKQFSYTWEHLEFWDGELNEQQQQEVENQKNIYGIYHAFSGELLASFFFYFVILLMTDQKTTLYTENNKLMPIITIVVAFHTCRAFTPRTGGSLNPATGCVLTIWRSIYYGDLGMLDPFFIYLIAPFAASFLAGTYYNFVHYPLAVNGDIYKREFHQSSVRENEKFLQSFQNKSEQELQNASLNTPFNENYS